MSSHWRKWITEPGRTRVVAVDATVLARELVATQGLAPAAQTGLADAVVGALLIASSHKSNESINLNAKGSALFRQAIVDASPEGRARGFLITNDEAPAATWGHGVLSILYTKNFEGKAPYTGMVQITDGTLETAINEYYRDSEQLTSRVGLDVGRPDEKLVARGVLIQAMGGATDDERRVIDALTEAELRDLAARAAEADFAAHAARTLGGVALVETETLPLASFCTCGVERIERALLLTGEADTREALGADPHLSITCDFCRREYTITADRITTLFSRDPSRLQ